MMAEPLELGGAVPLQRQKSLHSNILFIQEEHSKTLKALHEEIQRLQKKCSELTFSVAMGMTSSPQEDFYREQSETTQKELNATLQRLEEAQTATEKKDKRVNTLEQQLRAQEKKYQDVIKNKDQQLRQMKSELAEKAQENANLMYKQLTSSHDSTLYRVVAATDQDLGAGVAGGSGASPVPPIKVPIAPHPPRESGSGRRRRSPRALVAEGEPAVSAKVKLRTGIPAGQGLRRTNTPERVPVPTVFLEQQPTDQSTPCPKSTAKYNPLPPINSANASARGPARRYHRQGSASGAPQQQSRTFVPKHKAIHKHQAAAVAKAEQSSGSSSPEVEVLAVDTVIKRTHKLRRAQEYNADYK